MIFQATTSSANWGRVRKKNQTSHMQSLGANTLSVWLIVVRNERRNKGLGEWDQTGPGRGVSVNGVKSQITINNDWRSRTLFSRERSLLPSLHAQWIFLTTPDGVFINQQTPHRTPTLWSQCYRRAALAVPCGIHWQLAHWLMACIKRRDGNYF